MRVEFVDLKAQYRTLQAEMDAAIAGVIENTQFVGGAQVQSFEQEFAELIGARDCISCANGTDSLYIIMKMLGIGPGDEVITAANSWISSSETITQAGAKPVFADVDPRYYTMDPRDVAAKITPQTRAILPVHLYGQACDMDALKALCQEHGLHLIEDCAQAHLAEYKGQRVGTFGQAGSFSFYPGKNLGAYGDAGGIVTCQAELGRDCRMYARHGALVKHDHQMEGINSRMDGIQAAVLRVKMPHLEEWTCRRIENARAYDRLLEGVSEVAAPAVRSDSRHVYHLYVIRASRRDELQKFLGSKGIQTGLHYPCPLPLLPCYRHMGHTPDDFPVASQLGQEILSLPMFAELSQAEIEYVAACIREFYG